jgi:hypothetical protein
MAAVGKARGPQTVVVVGPLCGLQGTEHKCTIEFFISPEIRFMNADSCPRSCRCWPRPREPFAPAEKDFMEAVASRDVCTKDILSRVADMAEAVGLDRLGYLLSVPVRWNKVNPEWIVTPWIRLSVSWTPDAADAVAFATRMLDSGACLTFAPYQSQNPGWGIGWDRSSCWHPGRVTRRSLALVFGFRVRAECEGVWRRAVAQRRGQWRQWDHRWSRRRWLGVCVGLGRGGDGCDKGG